MLFQFNPCMDPIHVQLCLDLGIGCFRFLHLLGLAVFAWQLRDSELPYKTATRRHTLRIQTGHHWSHLVFCFRPWESIFPVSPHFSISSPFHSRSMATIIAWHDQTLSAVPFCAVRLHSPKLRPTATLRPQIAHIELIVVIISRLYTWDDIDVVIYIRYLPAPFTKLYTVNNILILFHWNITEDKRLANTVWIIMSMSICIDMSHCR